VDRQELDALYEQIKALDTKMAAQVAALRATREVAPSPRTPPPTLRQERAALWRIAMLCKDALASPALPPAWRPYFVQIARACRDGVQPQEGDRKAHGT
jgi:hypothetical protein